MMRYTFTTYAEQDFVVAAFNLESIQAAPALRIGASIQRALDLICRYPEIGRIDSKLTRKSGRKIRRLPCWPYVMFYYVAPAEVIVIGLIDGRRDTNAMMRSRLG